MNEIIKWGVIGSGGIARRRTIPEGILKAKHAGLVAVYDIDPEANIAVALGFGAKAAGSIEELLSLDIDAVYVASPANCHYEHVMKCAKAKKHVLCEKPLGLNLDEAKEMIHICKKEGVYLGTGLMMRFSSQHQTALEIISKGKLGKPVFGRAQLSCWYPPIEGAWRQQPETGGGGSLMDMGSHCIDLLEMFFGRIKRVSCFIHTNVHSYTSEDSAVASLFFENGAMAVVDTFFCIRDNSSKNVLELYGSNGSILAKGTIGQEASGEMIAYLEKNINGYNSQQERDPAEGQPINPEPVNTYLAEIEEFSQAVRENREPSNSAALGLRNLEVLSACYQSARSGKVIEV